MLGENKLVLIQDNIYMMHALVSVCSWGLSSDLKSPFGKFAV